MANYSPEKALQSHIQSLLYFWRGNGYCGPLKRNELFKVSDALLNLQRGLTGDRKLAGTEAGSYMQNEALLGAYLLYYWPVSFLQVQYGALKVKGQLEQLIQSRISSGAKSFRILDLGSGPGPASAALCDLIQSCLGDKSKLPVDLTLFDYSSKAAGLAKKLFARDFSNVNVEIQSLNFEKSELPLDERSFDIIITNHCINELWKTRKDCVELRTEFIKKAAEHLENDGMLFICEPALLLTSRNLIAVRDRLLDCGFKVLAPCVNSGSWGNGSGADSGIGRSKGSCENCGSDANSGSNGIGESKGSCEKSGSGANRGSGFSKVCPALRAGENQTCHAEIFWKPIEPVASIAQNAKLDRNSVKMTYFIFQKPASVGGATSAADDTLRGGALSVTSGGVTSAAEETLRTEALSVTVGDSTSPENETLRTEALSVTSGGPLKEISGLVVSDGMVNKAGRMRFVICNGSERITVSAKVGDKDAESKGFFKLKRYDYVSIVNPEIRGDASNISYGVCSHTEIIRGK